MRPVTLLISAICLMALVYCVAVLLTYDPSDSSCEEFKNVSLRDVPARCASYFE